MGTALLACSPGTGATGPGAASGSGGSAGAPPVGPATGGGGPVGGAGGGLITILDSGSTEGLDGGKACGSVELETTTETVVVPGNVIIVYDQSLSMNQAYNGTPRWRVAADAVVAALDPVKETLNAGALFFPTSPALPIPLGCDMNSVAPATSAPHIPLQPGAQFLAAWTARWQTAGLVLSTPIDAAMTRLDQLFATSSLSGETAVILVTDGEPTCFTTPDSVGLATRWASNGIKTYVIGFPGAISVTYLENVAHAGGTSGFLLPADVPALTQSITDISRTIVSHRANGCDVAFTDVPPTLDQVILLVTDATTGTEFRVNPGGEGYSIAADGSRATLLGATCDDAVAGRFSKISFAFGCADRPVLR